MQIASSLPPSPKTSQACTLPLPVPSSTAARCLPDPLAGGKLDALSSASIARQHGLSRPAGQRPPAREVQPTCQIPEPDPRVLQGTLPAAGAASAQPEGCGVAGAALRSWVLAAPQDWAVQLGPGSGCLPAPTEASPSLKDRTADRDHVVLPFWEITRFLGTHGSPPKRGLKPLVLAPHPSQGRRWAVTARANKASPPLQHQPSVVPQPPLPPKVGGRSVAGYDRAGFPPGLKRAG